MYRLALRLAAACQRIVALLESAGEPTAVILRALHLNTFSMC